MSGGGLPGNYHIGILVIIIFGIARCGNIWHLSCCPPPSACSQGAA